MFTLGTFQREASVRAVLLFCASQRGSKIKSRHLIIITVYCFWYNFFSLKDRDLSVSSTPCNRCVFSRLIYYGGKGLLKETAYWHKGENITGSID